MRGSVWNTFGGWMVAMLWCRHTWWDGEMPLASRPGPCFCHGLRTAGLSQILAAPWGFWGVDAQGSKLFLTPGTPDV